MRPVEEHNIYVLRTSTLHRYSCVCVTLFSAMPLQYLLKVAQPTGVGRRHIRKVAAYHNNCVHFHIKDTYVYRVELCTKLFYAVIPTFFPYFLHDLLSLHIVTFLMFFSLVVIHFKSG